MNLYDVRRVARGCSVDASGATEYVVVGIELPAECEQEAIAALRKLAAELAALVSSQEKPK